jgi:hypothetical protein
MATPLPVLSRDCAMRIVTDWRERLAPDFYIAHSIAYRPHEFVPTCDTIAVNIEPLRPRFPKPNEPATPMLALRETIEIWHAVSSCRGFRFHENTGFWEQALRLKFATEKTRVPLAVTESFPVVVLHWDPRGEREPLSSPCNMREVDFHLGVFFGILGADSTARSVLYQESMREVGAFVQSPRVQAVPIRVKLRLHVEKPEGYQFLSWISSTCERILAHLESLNQQLDPKRSVLQLAGLQLVVKATPRSVDYRWLHQLLEAMPAQLPFEFVSHPLASDKVMDQREVMPLLKQVIGKTGGPAGRLELLDLMTGVELVNLGAVCSLLPHSRSIVEVGLKVQSTLGLLWLAYAMFHPLPRQTKWTRLCFEDRHGPSATDLQIIRRFLGNSNGSEVFRCVASSTDKRLSEYPAALTTELSGTLRGYVLFTARLTKNTHVHAVNKPATRYLLAILPKDTKVELVVDSTSNLPESDHVIVPGCGLRMVPKAHLKEITTREYAGRRTSCITALHYQPSRRDDPVAILFLQEIISSLRHVRMKPPQAFVERSLPQNDLIKVIDGWQVTARSLEWMQRLPHLHSLGLSCTADQLDQVQSAIRSTFTGEAARSRSPLRALRLTVDSHRAFNRKWKLALPLLSATIRNELKSLRVFEIAFDEERVLRHPALNKFAAELPSSQPGLAMRELTFLWALRSWRLQCAGALDAYVVAVIFGFCGPSMDRATVTWDSRVDDEML